MSRKAKRVRLNPFFIRSAVEIEALGDLRPHRGVLIPSSSGLRLKFASDVTNVQVLGLNPFFIRSAVEMESDDAIPP